jgi:hypothetical protein
MQSVLASGPDATVVSTAPADAGVATSAVLALLPFGDDRLQAVTA